MSIIGLIALCLSCGAIFLAAREKSTGKAFRFYGPWIQITIESQPDLFTKYVYAKLGGYLFVFGFIFAFSEYGQGINGHPYEIGIGAAVIGFFLGPKWLEILSLASKDDNDRAA
jgi:hypothetical protein